MRMNSRHELFAIEPILFQTFHEIFRQLIFIMFAIITETEKIEQESSS